MSLSIVLVRRDAEKLKCFNFAASLKKRVADDVERNAYHIWFAATGPQEKRDKCESTFRMAEGHLTYREILSPYLQCYFLILLHEQRKHYEVIFLLISLRLHI